MMVFIVFEFIVVLAFLYLIANVIRYLLCTTRKEMRTGGFFGLSDKWLEGEPKEKKK